MLHSTFYKLITKTLSLECPGGGNNQDNLTVHCRSTVEFEVSSSKVIFETIIYTTSKQTPGLFDSEQLRLLSREMELDF